MKAKPFIIWTKNTPSSQKFIDHIRVKTVKYDALMDAEKTQSLTLLRRKYIDSPNVLFLINEIWLDNLVGIGHNQPSFISLYNNDKGGVDACCVSYSIMISQSDTTILAYYMDLFTVDSTAKPQILFQTHEHNQRVNGNPLRGGNITLFKKEIVGYAGVSPFIETHTYLYPILQERFRILNKSGTPILPPTVELKQINRKGDNSHYLMDFFKHTQCNIVSVEFATILNWIKLGYWFVFVMVQNDQVLAMYFFRDMQLLYEEYSSTDMNTRCIEMVNSFDNIGGAISDIFYLGFISAVCELSTKINLDFRLIQIPDISTGNAQILQKWNVRNTPILKTYLAFYFFNYCWKCDKGEVIILV